MTAKEKELLLSFIVNEDVRICDEINELRQIIRFRRPDMSDCFELILAQQRYSDFKYYMDIVYRLLGLGV